MTISLSLIFSTWAHFFLFPRKNRNREERRKKKRRKRGEEEERKKRKEGKEEEQETKDCSKLHFHGGSTKFW